MSKATKIMGRAKVTNDQTYWRLCRGQFSKELLRANLGHDLYSSAMRQFDRVAPKPQFAYVGGEWIISNRAK